MGLIPGLGRSPGEGHGNPLQSVFLLGESHGQRSLSVFGPQCCKELDTIEVTQHTRTWTVACQAPLPMEFSKQEFWIRVPFLTPCNLPDTGIKPMSLMSPALAVGFFITSGTWKAYQESCCSVTKSILYQSVVPYRVLTVASWPAYRFLRRQVRWSGIPIS